jgi:Kef-type K+ transport system membrane component KefB
MHQRAGGSIGSVLRVARDVAIIALLALVVDLAPGGGNAATAVLTAITLAFLALLAWAVYVLFRQNQFTWLSLTERQRAAVIVAVGVLALMLAGFDELLSTGLGTIVWAALVAAAVVTLWRTWIESRTY